MKKLLFNWGPVLVYMSLIFLLSNQQNLQPPISDKLCHVIEYALLGFLTARGVLLTWNLPRFWGAAVSIGIATAWGGLDEIHQLYIPGRQCSGFDFLADFFGATLGVILFIYLGVALYKSRRLYPRPHDKCC